MPEIAFTEHAPSDQVGNLVRVLRDSLAGSSPKLMQRDGDILVVECSGLRTQPRDLLNRIGATVLMEASIPLENAEAEHRAVYVGHWGDPPLHWTARTERHVGGWSLTVHVYTGVGTDVLSDASERAWLVSAISDAADHLFGLSSGPHLLCEYLRHLIARDREPSMLAVALLRALADGLAIKRAM